MRATSGSDVNKIVCSAYPSSRASPQNDLLVERPLYRPNATDRTISTLRPGPTTRYRHDHARLPWTLPPIAPPGGSNYEFLEAFTYGEMELMLYEDLEDLGLHGLGERFEVLGRSMCRRCTSSSTTGSSSAGWSSRSRVSRHQAQPAIRWRSLTPWLQDTNRSGRGWSAARGRRSQTDPFERRSTAP